MSKTYQPKQLKAMKVAYLTTQGASQEEIRKILSIPNQAEVSRLLSMAKKKNWYRFVFAPPDAVDLEEIQTPDREFMKKLCGRVEYLARENRGVPVENVHVLYSGPPGTEYNERLERFGRLAAERIVALLSQVTTCGVAWGRTVKAMVDGIAACSPTQRPEMQFMPLSGEPLNYTVTGISSSTAAERLAMAFGCEKLSLRGVATRIPRDLDRHRKVILRFVMKCEHYERIFSENSGLIEDVDAIISGIGDVKSSENDPWFHEAQQAEAIETERLNELAVGNLGGIWLERDRDNAGQAKEIADVNRRWLGIQKHHFEECAKRGADEDKASKAGVLVLAVGDGKAEIVRRAIGMINHLIIDQTLAERIAEE